jgi:lactate dehydrogenase-like 2-hydroxyacid dehydrogenase
VTQKTNSLRFFSAQDAEPRALEGERVAVLGYGNLGRAVALNLPVPKDSRSYRLARLSRARMSRWPYCPTR